MSNRLPSVRELRNLTGPDAFLVLGARERDLLDVYDNETLWHQKGQAYARKLIRARLKRIASHRAAIDGGELGAA